MAIRTRKEYGRKISLLRMETSSCKPSASFVNLNSSMITLPLKENVAAKRISLAISMPAQIFMRLYLIFIKSDTMMFIIDYHRRLVEISTLSEDTPVICS